MGTPAMPKIDSIVSRLIPPEGSKVVGQTPWDAVLYERTIIRAERVAQTDDDGTHLYKKHPTTGEKIYPLFRNKPKEITERFWLMDAGNGNVQIMPFIEKSAAEVAAEKRATAIAEAQRDLAAAMVDEGMSAGELVKAIKGKKNKEAA